MGRLLKLELENFKSYSGKKTIGPFEDFTAIIGPNGAGKSNLMDAISFVLGVQSAQLRSTHLVDLIYRGSAAGDGPRNKKNKEVDRASPQHALVSVHYRQDSGEQMVFSRSASAAGHSEYKVNGRVLTFAEYSRILEGENILIKARNFLVFQGDVEAMASKSPKELTRLVEQICGSDELGAEYDAKKEAMERAAELSAFAFNKKRGIASEMRLVKEQRDDVQKYEALMQERLEVQQEAMLWRLLQLETKAKELSTSIEQPDEGPVERSELALKEAKKRHAKAQKDLAVLERKTKKAEEEMDANLPSIVDLDERRRFAGEKIAKLEEGLEKCRREKDREESDLQANTKEMAQVSRAMAIWEESCQSQLAATEMPAQLVAEYNQLKTQAAAETAKERMRLENLERKMAPDLLAKRQCEASVAELDIRQKQLAEEKAALETSEADLKTALGRVAKEAEEQRTVQKAEQAQRRKLEQTEAEITERLKGAMDRLLQAKVERQESEREIKQRAMVESLKRLFPGVHGRIVDLCRPTHRRFETALAAALGRHLEAVVVDQERTALDCIQYLRDQRAGQATFLPLDTIQVKPVDEQFRTLVSGARPAIDVVQSDAHFQRAIQYVCGSALVCDSLDICRHICYEQGHRVKAISVDGSVIHKSGLMSGGGDAASAGKRWEEREVAALKSERDQCLSTLADISRQLGRPPTQNSSLFELEARQRYLADELSALSLRLDALGRQLNHIQKERQEALSRLGHLDGLLQRSSSEKQALLSSIAAVEDGLFSRFCQQIGFPNIREFEAARMSIAGEMGDRKQQFVSIISRLESQTAFGRERIRSLSARAASLERDVVDSRAKLSLLDSKVASMQMAIRRQQETLSALKADYEEAKRHAEQEGSLMLQAKKTRLALQAELDALLKKVSVAECELERLLDARVALIRRCKVEEIVLPLQGGHLLADVDPAATALAVDYSVLSSSSRKNGSEAFYQDRLKSLDSELEQLAPNLRSLDKLDGIEARLKSTMDSFEKTRVEAKRAKDQFSLVKSQRYKRFVPAFRHIAAKIDVIYKELTRSESVPTGGTAYLSLEDSEEPYLEGIKFHAMPPMKRFLDMDQLSGGEKTVAALALLFAIQSFRPAPFFILDEIDAALDNPNVQRVAKFLLAHSTVAAPMQFLVISLKGTLYEKANALVGIYRDPEERSSNVLTLRLSDYPE